MEEENSVFWAAVAIFILLTLGLIIAGFATGVLKVSQEPTAKEKCESAGGIYIDSWSDSCAFPPKENIQPARGDLQ